MIGIIAAATYVPAYRLDKSEIAAAWGGRLRGTRAVASVDEDSTTLAVEAARVTLRRAPATSQVTALYFATTAPAYTDKTNATAVHAALGLAPDAVAYDLCGSVRSGAAAVRAALDHAAAGGTALVVVADLRSGLPGGADESDGGDAATALLIGSGDGVVAELVRTASRTAEFLDRARTDEGVTVVWEERFGESVYLPMVREVAAALGADGGPDPATADAVVAGGPHRRVLRAVPKAVGATGSEMTARVDAAVGNTGTAHTWLLLTGALESAQGAQLLVALSVADGVDGFAFRTTAALQGFHERSAEGSTLRHQVEHPARPVSYPVFLSWRGQVRREPPRRPDPTPPAPPASARNTAWKFGLVAGRCRSCDTRNLPPQAVCTVCGARDSMAAEPMIDVPAVVRTFTVDRLAFSLSPPVVFAVVDFEGGGRLQCELTDVDAGDVEVGMRVEPTFRRLSTAAGIHNYFWKARPASTTKES